LRDTLSLIYKDDGLGGDLTPDLGVCFAVLFKPDFGNNVLPAQFYASLSGEGRSGGGGGGGFEVDLILGALLNNGYLSMITDSIAQKPIFVLFKELASTGNQSHEREILIQLLSELYMKQNRVGYYFLYYMYSVMLRLQLSTSACTNVNNANKTSKGGRDDF
jgi:hypothetical protein